ncbi:PREDICTED: formin-like protein 5 [Vollenhovia emeryi]|uniref:formin-like protein 5 n=1 Tax=Vollenhovia emeryi TaxID=411798 RepID=UPI0005F3DA86|nr:PREDICTED: formin-like protein 5 [Vollenhovia emeryi]
MARAGENTAPRHWPPAPYTPPRSVRGGFQGPRISDAPGTTTGAATREAPRTVGVSGVARPPSVLPAVVTSSTLPPPGQTPARTRGPSQESPRLGTTRVVTPSKALSSEGLPPQARGERHPRPQRQPPASGLPDPDLGIRPSGSEGPQPAELRLGNVRAAPAVCHLYGRAEPAPHARTHVLKGRRPETQGVTARIVRCQTHVTVGPAPHCPPTRRPAPRTVPPPGSDPSPPPRQDHVQPSDGRATLRNSAGAPACNELRRV